MVIKWFLLAIIFTPTLSSRMLYLAPVNSSSHNMWNSFLATELAKRGHEITYITSAYVVNKMYLNVKYFKQSQVLIDWQTDIVAGFVERRGNILHSVRDKLTYECEKMFESGPYKEFLSSEKIYDVIIIEYVGHDCLLGFAGKFQSPVVLVSAVPYMPVWSYRSMGTPLFHMLPHVIDSVVPPYGFWKRLSSLNRYLFEDFAYFFHTQPKMDQIIKNNFGEYFSLEENWKKVAVLLTNTADWMNKIPLTPNIIPIGGMHLLEPSGGLNKDLNEFINGSEQGTVLVSFGTIFPLETNLEKFRIIASAVGKLPQRILWKWDQKNDFNITFPKNVLRLPWIPQNDVLGHPKVILFVSHCGGQSSLEAMYHGVPVLGIPGFWDQSENANRIVAENAGLRLDFEHLSEKSFLDTAKKLISNLKYKDGALKLRSIMRDQPIKALDRATFWIEFVTRNKGAHHFRPLSWDLPHLYTCLVDVVVVVVGTLSTLSAVVCFVYVFCRAKRFPEANSPKNKMD